MKKFALSIILSLLPSFSFAQSLEETQEWISNKAILTKNVDITYSFSNDSFVYKWNLPLYNGEIIKTIPLERVSKISYYIKGEYATFILSCDEACVYEEENNEEGKFIRDTIRDKFYFEFKIISQDNIPKRMEKALLRLIKLNGGNAKIIPYKAEKEAF